MNELGATAMSSRHRNFLSTTASLEDVRVFVRQSLVELGAGELSMTAALVASELATNAVENGSGVRFGVEVRVRDPSSGSILVRNEAVKEPAIPRVEEWHLDDPAASRGRGLGIVYRLAQRVAIDYADSHVTVVADLHSSTLPTAPAVRK